MHRIDTPTAQPDKFGPGKNGFTGGNPQTGQLPTALDQDFFDALQEEIARVVEGAGLELDKQNHGQMLVALGMMFASKDSLGEGSALPVGVPVPWPTMVPPAGWVSCIGQTFTTEQWPKLAIVYPSLKLPDLRGEFIRAWDNGRGADVGRTLLSFQNFAVQNITGRIVTRPSSGVQGPGSIVEASGAFSSDVDSANMYLQNQITSTNARANAYTFDASRVANTATETRPRNIAFNFIVRAK